MSPLSDLGRAPAPTRRTVLLVEDNDDLRGLFRDALKYAGFTVIDVGDGPAALRILDYTPVDAIVLDIGLPTLDGYSVRDELAANVRTTDIPVIVVTAHDADRERLDPACILRKPVNPFDLITVVRNCLARKPHGV